MFFVVVITCIFLKYHVNCKDYCGPNFCSNSKQHTMCKYKIEGPAPDCVIYEKLIKDEKDKQEILDKINSRKNKVASGEIRSFPSANNMLKLEWNEDLALSAQRWADQCITNGTSLDVCRDLENTSVGQNVATVYGEAPRLSPATLVDLWYMELLHFNASIISRYQRSSTKNLAHYDYFTQLIWGNTRQVGCGASKFQEKLPENKNRTNYRLVCNFLPSGNIEGQRIYDEGVPCTHCPYDNNCDLHFTSLCDQPHTFLPKENEKFQIEISKLNKDNFGYPTDIVFDTKETIYLKTRKENESHQESTETNNTDSVADSFDLFEHLFNTYNKSETQKTERTGLCKELLAVDEFIDLLRKKLSTDNMLKDLLTTKSPQSDIQYSDPKIDAIVSKLYSKKTPSTTTKATNSEIINSTLLVDLVEAVIFRNRGMCYLGAIQVLRKHSRGVVQDDKISTVEIVIPSTEDAEGRTIQMQAELGEVQRNLEFTGHYFFPEEDDENQSNPTEFYYDQSNIPVSEIVLEIEQLKRNKETNDFIEDILESEFNTETVTPNHVITSDIMNDASKFSRNKYEFRKYYFNDAKFVERSKRDTNIKRSRHNEIKQKYKFYRYDDIILSYNELLRLLANDLKELKLNSKYHCAHNLVTSKYANISITLTLIVTVTLTYLYLFYYNL